MTAAPATRPATLSCRPAAACHSSSAQASIWRCCCRSLRARATRLRRRPGDFSCNHVGVMTRGADASFWLVLESGLGMSGSGQDSRLVSDFSMQDVQNSAQAGGAGIEGFSVELWLQPSSLQQREAVFSIGAVYPAGSQQDDDSQLNVGDSLLLLQDGSAFSFVIQVPAVGITDYVITVDSPTSALPQPYLGVNPHAFTPFSSAAPTLTQLVLVLNGSDASMAVYVNGQLAVTGATGWDGDLSGWFTADSLLSFAQTSSSAAGETWAGDIRLLAVYTTALSADSVYGNWNASLPSPVPQPVSSQNVSWSRLHPPSPSTSAPRPSSSPSRSCRGRACCPSPTRPTT